MSTTERFRELEASIGREAQREGKAAWLVGGTVRDRLRRRAPRDLDVAVEGDAVAFARSWAKRRKAGVDASGAFGTASVLVRAGKRAMRVDFSSARGETYRHPGALPDVFPGGIEADLSRRDFTINAMAIPLTGPSAGTLLDPHGGRDDLRRGLVRMLHAGSPHDDPTRAYRAVRFALRLGFRIAPETRRWIAGARNAGAFAAVSGDRLRRELCLLLAEQPPGRAAAALSREGLDRSIDPDLAVTPAVRARLTRLGRIAGRAPAAVRCRASLFAWGLDLPADSRGKIAVRLRLAGGRKAELVRIPDDLAALRALFASRAPDSEIAALARSWSEEETLAVESALAPGAAAALRRAKRRAARVRLAIGGEDLKRSGLAAGPAIGRALDRTWRARVDGRIRRAEELEYAIREGAR
jgi:tRNA nucleotidyltransferase (CCA-adding enzyme)